MWKSAQTHPADRVLAAETSWRDPNILMLLIVLDASEASRRVLQYIGQMLGGCDQIEFDLAHIAPRMPAQFLESGGSELLDRELEIESDLRAQQNRWIAMTTPSGIRFQRCARRC
jgi:hypothetical protein